MAYQEDAAFERMERSSGGMVEAVKTGTVLALRELLKGQTFTNDSEHLDTQAQDVWVDIEYPVKVENYPGIWVQFSVSELQPSGMGHETISPAGELIQQWAYKGRISLVILAQSSVQRDRISDTILNELAFSHGSEILIPGVDSDRRTLQDIFNENPYVSIGLNQDVIRPGGQSITVGTPWDPDALVYEDNYGFDILGEFQRVRTPDGAVVLRAINIVPENATLTMHDQFGWH